MFFYIGGHNPCPQKVIFDSQMQFHLEDELLLTISSRAGAEASSAVIQAPICLKPFRTETVLPAREDMQEVPRPRNPSQQPSHFCYIKLLNKTNS